MDTEINLSSCCRTCLRLGCRLTPISAEDNDSVKFSFKLMSCIAEIAWSRIDIPSFICDQCIEHLKISYNFRSTCITADETLQKYVKQSRDSKIDIKNTILFASNSKYTNCVSNTNKHNSINNLPDEDTNNSEYLHLKHFLDSEEDLSKSGGIISDNEMSRSGTPETTEEDYIENYNESQTIELEVQDIQEIIIQAKPEEMTEQGKLILSNGQQFNIHNLTSDPNTEIELEETEEQSNIIQHTSAEESVKISQKCQNKEKSKELNLTETKPIVLAQIDRFGFLSTDESILGSDQSAPVPKVFQTIKATKSTGVQVCPPTPEKKQLTKAFDNPNKCLICGNTYRKKANLKVHMRSHTGEKPYECKYCEKRFYHSSHLTEHIRRHTGEKRFQCNVCSKRFTIRGELTMHMKTHTGEKPHACTVCDRRCLTSSDLKIHMRIHTGEKPYTCGDCGKKFSSSYILSSHIKIHTGDRPFPCKLCEKSFTQSSHLTVHMKKHTGEKFSCKICSATFAHSSQLTVHKRDHTGKQPYKCGVCNKLCNYSSELQNHMARHTGQKFSCDICQKQFSTSSYLSEHTRVHTGENLFNCTICDRTFTRNQYLEKHIRTHTGEKPYACLVCGKAFSQSSSLKVHTRIHTGERPFTCNMCDKTFITSSELSSHLKRHKKYIDL